MLPLLPSNHNSLGQALPYSLPNFHDINDQQQLSQYENNVLNENYLFRMEIPRSSLLSSNLFKAISYCLYMTTFYEDFVKKLCIDFLSNLLLQKQELIPKRLRIFHNNQQLFTDYCQDTTNPKFTLLSFELISAIFQAKIVIYELDDNQYLRSTILNNSQDSQLSLFKDRLGCFDHVESLPFMIKFNTLKTMVMEIIENSVKTSEKKKTRRDSDRLFEELNRDIDNEINQPLTVKTQAKENVKAILVSSSSLEFLESTTVDQTAEKQKDHFFFNGSAEFKEKSFRQGHDLWGSQLPSANEKDDLKNASLTAMLESRKFMISTALHNPFTIDQPVQSSDQKESPKFNNGEERSSPSNSSFRQKKLKNIALKCTSEEFILPFSKPYDFGKKVISPQPIPLKKQPLVLEETKERYLGTLKFFDEVKGYGFIIMDIDNSEIFVHYDDFIKTQGVQREMLMTFKLGNIIRVCFSCMKYIGKYNMSRKAVEVQVLSTSF